MFLSISIADALLWVIHILLWFSCIFGLIAILQFAKLKLPIRILTFKSMAALSGLTFLVSMIGILAFEDKLLIAAASGHWNFGDSFQNELHIDLEHKKYEIKESNGKTIEGSTTKLTKSDSTVDTHHYLYLLGYPNEMSSMMVKFKPLHSPQLKLQNRMVPCK
jgi:hypothetical protein